MSFASLGACKFIIEVLIFTLNKSKIKNFFILKSIQTTGARKMRQLFIEICTLPKVLRLMQGHQDVSKQEAQDLSQVRSMGGCLFDWKECCPNCQPNRLLSNGYASSLCYPSEPTSCYSISPWGHSRHLHPRKKTAFRYTSGFISLN